MLGKHGKITRRLAAVVLGGALLASLGACNTEDQNALLVYGPDSAVVVAPLTAPAFLMPPGGTAEASELELISFNPSATDAFGRTSDNFSRVPFPHWFSSGYWSWGAGRQHVYDWDTGDVDPRLPALTRTTPLVDPWRMYIAVTGVFAGDGYDIYGETCCLAPSTRYIAGFERMALTVNGELDHVQVLLGQPVDQPDELNYLGGQPGGDHTRSAMDFNDGSAYPTEAEANPLVFGWIETFSDGYMVLDVVMSCMDANGVQIWMCDATPNQDFSVVAPNQQVRHTFPNYNYITIWEANPDGTPNFDRPVMRKQMGTDLSALGGPINNAYAPFPREALSDAELALGTGGVSRPAEVTMILDNLKELVGGAGYAVWAVMSDGSTQPLEFTYNDGAAPVTSFVGGEGTHKIDVVYPDDATHIMVSIEGAASTGSPSDQQILWAPGLQEAGQVKSTDLPVFFGTFGERVWDISGKGSGGLFGDEFRERFEHLPRPPVGYKYVTWLASGDTLFVRLPDESFTSPPPEYAVLEAADRDDTISGVVQPLEILTAFSKICLTAVSGCQGPYDLGEYDTFILTLEPRSGASDEIGPTRVLEALIPTPKPRE